MKRVRGRRQYCRLALVALLGLALLVTACARQGAGTSAPAAQEKVQEYLHFIGGAGPGMSRIYTTGLATLLQKYEKMNVSVETISGTERYYMMNKGELDLEATSTLETVDAYYGRIGAEKTRIRDLVSGAAPATTIILVLTRQDTGIKTIKDLRGKKLNGESPERAWNGTVMELLLKANGMTKDDVKWLIFEKQTINERDLVEKRVDAGIMPGGPRVTEIDKSVGAYLIPISPDEQKYVSRAMPAAAAYTMPKGTYGYKSEVPTLASPTHLMVRAGMNDITAYTLVKTLFEHIGEFHEIHAQAKGFTLENALSHIVFPVHPGAVRYYKEKGVWTKEHEAKQQELLAKEKEIFGK